MPSFYPAFSVIVLSLTMGLPAQAASKLTIKKENLAIAKQTVAEYADLAFALYQDAVTQAKTLQTAAKNFTQTPTKLALAETKNAWKQARRAYSRTEALRFYAGPIDNPETGPEGLLNAWPIDESYIDYVKGNLKAGIVQNPKLYPNITKELLLSMNEKNGEKNISTGYHAVEFLLWGQDFSTSTPGQRPVSDYIAKNNKYATRRTTYLNLLCDLIVEHLEAVLVQWNPSTKNSYREAFLKEDPTEALRRIFTGITSLSVDEMAGERMTVALEIHDQENEQDCFSDYSLYDGGFDQEGIVDVVTKTSLLKLMEKENPELATQVVGSLEKSTTLFTEAQKIGDFDKIIAEKSESAPGHKKVRELIAALDKQAVTLAKAGKNMGLELNIETEEH